MSSPSSTVCADPAYLHAPPVSSHISDPTMGLMMLLSTLQYQAPHIGPFYQEAAKKVGRAAFVESGGQSAQDGVLRMATDKGKEAGLESQMALLVGAAKTVRDRELTLNGPKIDFVKTKLTVSPNSGTLGFGWNW